MRTPRRAGRASRSSGGGIAGLSAALKLADKGVASTIYEASPNRVGGRMHTDDSGYWANGQVSEFCGELIDSGHATIRGLAKRFGLRLDNLLAAEPRGTTDTYSFFGSYYSVDQADADFAAFSQTVFDQADAAGYPTTWDSSTPTGRHARPHVGLRLDRARTCRAGTTRRWAGCSTPRTPRSTARTRPARRR